MRIGIDLGGTKTEGIVLDDGGAERARKRISTPRSYEGTLEALISLVNELETHTPSRATVGIGIPGTIVPDTGLVKNANSTWLIGKPLQRDLERLLHRSIRITNDANCFALSEATDGAGAEGHVVFGVILGTGVGGGIVIGREPLTGRNLVAGEWGHNPLPWPDEHEFSAAPACYCGKCGCIETWLSGPGFENDYARSTGHRLDSRTIVANAAAGEKTALDALDRYYDRLAKALSSVINIVDPDVIVLGGGMSNIPDLAELVEPRLLHWVFSDRVETSLRRNFHGDSSGVRGAAWLWPNPAGNP